jgi:hypothetical protein
VAGENWQGMLEAVKNPRPKRKYKKRKIRGFTSAETNKLLGLGTMRSFHRLTASGNGPPRVRIGREDWFPARKLARHLLGLEK